MKKINLNNTYESILPPTDKSVYWVKRDSNGEILSIARFKKGEWIPFLVSVDYMKPNKND